MRPTLRTTGPDEELTSPVLMARMFLALRRLVRQLQKQLEVIRKEERGTARGYIKQIFTIQTRLEEGLPLERDRLLILREMQLLEERVLFLLGEPRAIEFLDPEDMLVCATRLKLATARFRPVFQPHTWPVRYDLYRFQVLGRLMFGFLDEFKKKEARTEACIAKMRSVRMTPNHEQRKLDVVKHLGVYAVRVKKQRPEGT